MTLADKRTESAGRAARQIPFGRPILGEAEKEAVARVLSGHILTDGRCNAEFEARFAELIGTKHAITTSSCTSALHLSLLALGVGPGDEVIVPAQTHVATAHVVEHCGGRPVFVDVSRDTGNISPQGIRAALTPNTKAVIVVHYLGLPCDMDSIDEIAGGAGIHVVEDCALSLGAVYGVRKTGSMGATGCFSFYPSKHITTTEGGMLTTNDDDIAWRVRKQRAFGYDKGLDERRVPGVYDVIMLGYNYRMSELHAAIGLCQLDRLDGFLARRRQNCEALGARLRDLENIVVLPSQDGPAQSSHYCVNAVLDDGATIERSQVIEALGAAGVGTSVHYPVALPHAVYYRDKYGDPGARYPVARWISDRAVSLPCGPHLDVEDMAYIADQFALALGRPL